jgi:DNA/RNA endonuclease YhcR with UshA esterase domain
MKRHLLSVVAVLALVAAAWAEDAPKGEKPAGEGAAAVIKASDKDALEAAKGKQATVEGTVSEAGWSKSGKVMNIKFEGADESGFVAVVFQRDKEAFDKAFDGDAAKGLTGKKVTVTGKVGTFRDKPQIILNKPEQVKVEDGEKAGAEKPAEK